MPFAPPESPVRARNLVHRVYGGQIAGVVQDQDGDTVLRGEALEGLERLVVGVVDAAVSSGAGKRPDPLEEVHHHEPAVRVDPEPILQQFGAALAHPRPVRGDVQALGRSSSRQHLPEAPPEAAGGCPRGRDRVRRLCPPALCPAPPHRRLPRRLSRGRATTSQAWACPQATSRPRAEVRAQPIARAATPLPRARRR